MSRPTASRPGFTLVEMIVATLLLAIGVSAAMLALSTSSQASYRAERVQTAALLAQKQMTEIELQTSQLTGGEQQGNFGEQYPEYKWKENVEATNYPELFKVTLTVQWDLGHTPPRESLFTTYLRNPQNATTHASQVQSVSTAGSTTSGTGTP